MPRRAGYLAAAIACLPQPAAAHAFAQRYDLPLPLWLYLAGAGATVAVSFLIVALFVRRNADSLYEPRLELLRTPVGRGLTHPAVLSVIRGSSVGIFLLLVLAGLVGTQDYAFNNILPTAVWVIWWIGIAFVSALVGDLWALVNPWRIIAEWVAPVWPAAAPRRRNVPTHAAVWPAVGLFLGFAWAELVWPDRSVPANLAGILLYSAITWLGMYHFGIENWLRRGETFSILFSLFARFAPLELRLADGQTADSVVVEASDFRRSFHCSPTRSASGGICLVRPTTRWTLPSSAPASCGSSPSLPLSSAILRRSNWRTSWPYGHLAIRISRGAANIRCWS